jgi:shikimate dehydrogenase
MDDLYTPDDLRAWADHPATPAPIQLAVIGDPIAQSRSPLFQNAGLRAAGIAAAYGRLHVPRERLAETLELLPKCRFLGANVTFPHKTEALRLAASADPLAAAIGAANTLLVEGGTIRAFNTDAPGFARAIRATFQVDLRDLRVVVLGAGGGAGRAIAHQCAADRCERLVLVNRTHEKARALADELAPRMAGPRLLGANARLKAIPWEEGLIKEELAQADLAVNATNIGMHPGDPSVLPEALILPHLMVYDAVYAPARTPLLRAAEAAGARAANGFAMLLHQGALAFEIWFGREAPLQAMETALRDSLDAK